VLAWIAGRFAANRTEFQLAAAVATLVVSGAGD